MKGKSKYEEISKRISNDSTYRKALEQDAHELIDLLGNSVLSTTDLSVLDKIKIISLFFPGYPVDLDTSSLEEAIEKKRSPRDPTRPPGVGGDLPPGGSGCLAIGTSVLTPSGLYPIESLTVGAEVTTNSGTAKIVGIRRYDKDGLVQVDLGYGMPVRCSSNHPFISPKGKAIQAQHLEKEQHTLVDAQGEELSIRVSAMQGRFEVYELVLDSGDYIYVGEKSAPSRPSKEM